jgi:hypothetical protein
MGLVLLTLSLGVIVIVYNVKEIVNNPVLGVKNVYTARAQLVREIEGVKNFSKQELINLDRGDGMRFLSFARQHLSEDSILVFPAEQFTEPKGDSILGALASQHFIVTLYPRRFLTDTYDFHRLPFADSAPPNAGGRLQMFGRDYCHSRTHYVFRIFVSPDVHRYRFFMTAVSVTGQKDFGNETCFILYPDADQP